MITRSLHLRLLAAATVAIFVALAVAWLAMTWLFAGHIERREAAELTRTAEALVAALGIDAAGAPLVEQEPTDVRALRPSGGLYWQITTPRGAIRSRSLWDESLAVPPVIGGRDWRTRTANGPFDQQIFLVEREVRPADGVRAVVQVAVDTEELSLARREFGQELALFLTGLWVVLSLAALAQVRLGLAPLAPLREALARMRRNPTARLEGGHVQEIAPLVEAINALADARQGDVERARRRAADLAHSLKTPLSALAAQSRRARADGAVEAADGLDRAIAAVSAALEAELARARAAAARDASADVMSEPAALAERLVKVLERTDAGERVGFTVAIAADLRAPVPPDVMTEVLGALMENAARHAHGEVHVAGGEEDGTVQLTVGDDGPGLDTDRAEIALMRGGRLDEAGPGHGLGLAIVRDLVSATDGEIKLGRSPLGGLQVTLIWNCA